MTTPKSMAEARRARLQSKRKLPIERGRASNQVVNVRTKSKNKQGRRNPAINTGETE
ncbi:MAG: hypothetical protein GY906_23230 [bacterium]|nr:hypothetical protein [bacterium]